MRDTIVIIPAHLNSVRLPKKILLDINGLPMIEHVRRRILLNVSNDKVFIATCNKSIAKIIKNFGGNVIMTSKNHKNGTSRISEAIQKINCKKVILAQGDEPLILPNYFKKFYDSVNKDNKSLVWNATAPLKKADFKKISYVKCQINSQNVIVNLFRKINYFNLRNKKLKTRKILGLIAFQKKILLKYKKFKNTKEEKKLSIEQIRYLKNNIEIKSVFLSKSFESINEPKDIKVVINQINNNPSQRLIFDKIINQK